MLSNSYGTKLEKKKKRQENPTKINEVVKITLTVYDIYIIKILTPYNHQGLSMLDKITKINNIYKICFHEIQTFTRLWEKNMTTVSIIMRIQQKWNWNQNSIYITRRIHMSFTGWVGLVRLPPLVSFVVRRLSATTGALLQVWFWPILRIMTIIIIGTKCKDYLKGNLEGHAQCALWHFMWSK